MNNRDTESEQTTPRPHTVTLTGIDYNTHLSAIAEFPEWVEFGILYTWTPENRNRYPGRATVVRMLETLSGRRLALHVCGQAARHLLASESLQDMTDYVQRIQVNGIVSAQELTDICQSYPHHKIITQHTRKNAGLCIPDIPNHALLVDDSGGRGRSPDHWDRPVTKKSVGFAGGLGPDNITSEISRIQSIATGDWWVDMEGKLRDEEDWFDVDKAAAIVLAVDTAQRNE